MLAVGDVSYVVQGFHGPVGLNQFGQTRGACLLGEEAGDGKVVHLRRRVGREAGDLGQRPRATEHRDQAQPQQ
ncbi:hypothetical protein ACG2OD_09270 [Streptomyces sp. PDY-4]|uniref:hypothetical protein n=1 Tax=Streptomyces TaxID=1883 RepID=UPI00331CDFA0